MFGKRSDQQRTAEDRARAAAERAARRAGRPLPADAFEHTVRPPDIEPHEPLVHEEPLPADPLPVEPREEVPPPVEPPRAEAAAVAAREFRRRSSRRASSRATRSAAGRVAARSRATRSPPPAEPPRVEPRDEVAAAASRPRLAVEPPAPEPVAEDVAPPAPEPREDPIHQPTVEYSPFQTDEHARSSPRRRSARRATTSRGSSRRAASRATRTRSTPTRAPRGARPPSTNWSSRPASTTSPRRSRLARPCRCAARPIAPPNATPRRRPAPNAPRRAPRTPKGPRPGGGAHWGRRIFAVIALVVIVGALYVVNQTFQPFHGDGEGTVAVDDPGQHRRRRDRRAARGEGRRRLRALLRAQGDDQRRPRQAAPRQVHAQEGHDQRRGDHRADEGPRGAEGRRDRQRDARRGPVAQGERAGRRRQQEGRGRLRQGDGVEDDAAAGSASSARRRARRPPRASSSRPRTAQGRLDGQRARQAAARRVRGELQERRHELRQEEEAHALRRADHRVDDRARGAAGARAPAGVGGHLQPAQGGYAARDRRHDPLRDEQLEAPDPPVRARQAGAVQHAAQPRAAADADRQPRPGVDQGRRQALQQDRTCSTSASPASPASTRSLRPTRSSRRTAQKYQASRDDK